MKTWTTILILTMAIFTNLFGADPIGVGEDAPVVEVTTDTGETLNLGDVYTEGPTLIYFYPKSFTPGCTKQACNVRDNFDELEEAGIRVLGVSADDVEKQAEFRKEYELPFTLIADPDKKLGKAFGVGGFMGVYSRQSFLIVDGKIAWRDLSASPGSQTADALAALNEVRNKKS